MLVTTVTPVGHHDVSNAGWKVICGPHAGHQCLHPALNAEDAEAAGHLARDVGVDQGQPVELFREDFPDV